MALMDASHLTSEPVARDQSGRFKMGSKGRVRRNIPRIALTMVVMWGFGGQRWLSSSLVHHGIADYGAMPWPIAWRPIGCARVPSGRSETSGAHHRLHKQRLHVDDSHVLPHLACELHGSSISLLAWTELVFWACACDLSVFALTFPHLPPPIMCLLVKMKATQERPGFVVPFSALLLSQLTLMSPSYAQDATKSPATPSLPQTYPAAATPSDNPPPHDASVFNFYFLFLAAFGVLVAAFLWWFHLRRQRRKHAHRMSGQHAMAQDLEGWVGARRFMHGSYGRYEAAGRVRREDGLDENGEAPPPYQPKSEVGLNADAVRGASSGGSLAIPLRAIVRDGAAERPPGYSADART
jgi:hypothetical protein